MLKALKKLTRQLQRAKHSKSSLKAKKLTSLSSHPSGSSSKSLSESVAAEVDAMAASEWLIMTNALGGAVGVASVDCWDGELDSDVAEVEVFSAMMERGGAEDVASADVHVAVVHVDTVVGLIITKESDSVGVASADWRVGETDSDVAEVDTVVVFDSATEERGVAEMGASAGYSGSWDQSITSKPMAVASSVCTYAYVCIYVLSMTLCD